MQFLQPLGWRCVECVTNHERPGSALKIAPIHMWREQAIIE